MHEVKEINNEPALNRLFKELFHSGTAKGMGPQAFSVLIVAMAYIGTNQAHLPITRITEHVGLSRRQVRREIAKLEYLGHLERVRTGRVNRYVLPGFKNK